jgi:hypothetical protein
MPIIVTSSTSTFLGAVNRILRIAGIIRGDTDPIQTFADLQHGATMNLAIIAVQDTLTDLTAFYDFPMERSSSSITLLTGQRTYDLATDFVSFWQSNQFFYDTTEQNHIFEYPGGERKLAQQIFRYQSDQGSPTYWYYVEGATKQVGFYQTPDSNYNNRVLTYDYEKDIIPINATDTMPFLRDIESNTFCQLATVRFQSLFNANPKEMSAPVEQTPQYINSRATLLKLINPKIPDKYYGITYPR